MCVCMYVCMYVYVGVYVCMYVCMYVIGACYDRGCPLEVSLEVWTDR